MIFRIGDIFSSEMKTLVNTVNCVGVMGKRIASIAFPALGCGNGGLSWNVVGPLMYQYLHDLEIDIVVYAPYETSQEQLTVENLQSNIII